MKRKFKTRVKHFSGDKYLVQYAYYRFIPIWYSLHFWFEQTLTGNTECWTEDFFNIDEAEKLAKSLKSIEDVKNWYKPDEEKRERFYQRKREYLKKAVPYRSKEFE
ncbi:hypothetical protein CL684_01610 [Candidatus Campbellbacteria bacterium]|nr:hypothetical protein [Candidatus Campbellbacteria bacterium]|tara:strand:- start:36 stop:353 length:318 start_codon:yes stop_codon:yes gene_type:complete